MYKAIKRALLDFHRARGFTLYDSFPLVGDDPTVLFTNATITPFKHLFEDVRVVPHDYALVQKCLRVGGGAGDLNTARNDPNYSSLFEMFGSGLFGCTHTGAIKYFLELLQNVGLSMPHLRFVVPDDGRFLDGLRDNDVPPASVFAIDENGSFWQEWHFGRQGLVGKGLTAVYVRRDRQITSVDEMANQNSSCVEIGNLIHIYGQMSQGEVIPAAHEGFDVGIGLGRIAIARENKTLYELEPLSRLTSTIDAVLADILGSRAEEGTLRVLTDLFRSIDALIQEGVRPGNKRQAFVLRKLIRSLCEEVWLCAGEMVTFRKVTESFAGVNRSNRPTLTVEVVEEEASFFRNAMERGRVVVAKTPSLSPDVLRDTYGIRESLLPLILKMEN